MIKKTAIHFFSVILSMFFMVGSLESVSRRRGARPKRTHYSSFSPLPVSTTKHKSASGTNRGSKRAIDPLDAWIESYQNYGATPHKEIQDVLAGCKKTRGDRSNRSKAPQEIGDENKTSERRLQQKTAETEETAQDETEELFSDDFWDDIQSHPNDATKAFEIDFHYYLKIPGDDDF